MVTYWIFWFRSEGHEGCKEVSQAFETVAMVPRVFPNRLLKDGVLWDAIITDKLRSYSAARTEVMPSVEHLQQKYQNNRAENSHQPTRMRPQLVAFINKSN